MKTASEKILQNSDDIFLYLVETAKVALLPFSNFGAEKESPWFRLSVGCCDISDIKPTMENIRAALLELSKNIS